MMIPHAKIVLSLLVAASKVHHVFTVDRVPEAQVERVLHSDIRDPATASTSSGIDSLTAQTKLDVVDEDRQVTRIHETDGHAIPTGEQLVPTPKIGRLVSGTFKSPLATTKRYKKLVWLLDRLRHETNGLETKWDVSKKAFLGTLDELSNYHKKYLAGAVCDIQHADGALIEDLSKIFGSIRFPHPSEYDVESDELKDQGVTMRSAPRVKTRSALRVKTRIETCVFKTLDCLYHFAIITPEQMRTFFNSQDALQRTATHLSNLFSSPRVAFTGYHTFTPELGFILKDWHTEHLHHCLEDLDGAAQQQLVHQTLKITIENFKYFDPEQPRNRASSSINEFVSQADFLQKFQSWSASHLADEDDLLKRNVKEIIKLFDEYWGPLKEIQTFRAYDMMTTELLLNFYILHFIKQHANQHVKKLIEIEESTAKALNLKFQWITSKLKLKQVNNWHDDYNYFLNCPVKISKIISPAQVSLQGKADLYDHLLSALFEHHVNTDKLIEALPGLHADDGSTTKIKDLTPYIPLMENSYDNFKWNSWLKQRDVVEMPQLHSGKVNIDKSEFDELMRHLLVNYNGLDYTSSSGGESAETELAKPFLEETKIVPSRRLNPQRKRFLGLLNKTKQPRLKPAEPIEIEHP